MKADISNILALLPQVFPGTVSVRIVLVNFSDRDTTDAELVKQFLHTVPLHIVPRLEFSTYHCPGTYQRGSLPLIGYPFFIRSDDSFLLISDTDDNCKLLEDKDFQRQYSQSFEEFLKKCPPMSTRGMGLQDYTNALGAMLQYSDHELLYTVEHRPCIISVVPMDLVVKYAPAELKEIAQPYVSFFQSSLHLKEYFSPEGFEEFRNDRIFHEAGPDIFLSEQDTETLCSLILGKVGTDMFFLDSSRLQASRIWSIASGRNGLIFAKNDKAYIFALSLDPQICSTFYDYFSHLDEDGAEMC